ncbi:methionine gamma-lyase family protein [Eubacteriales bacterium OttesenSCG-928-G02]|nr:methionine gamma-lyase family protein [Eubacteriales bacterium OttesenSCG-928-G02]
MITNRIRTLAAECDKKLIDVFKTIDDTAYKNTERIMNIFKEERVSVMHFNPSTGYGYNDDGRDTADRLFAKALGCEDGFVRHNIISGTHAITIGLFGILRPGDTMLSVTGKPYDTLESVIGFKNEPGSLADFGIKYEDIPLIDNNYLDMDKIKNRLKSGGVKMVYVQRSKGYLNRRTLTANEITELYYAVKEICDAYVFVDNCYGEFTALTEPKADILAGSLIKNPGGGMAENGGYIVGTKKAVELAATRLSVPGIGAEAGASLGNTKNIIKGLFYAPHTVANALKTAHFAALLFKELGYNVSPEPFELREDIIQIILLQNSDNLLKFCQGIQEGSPIDSFATPIPDDMPGYNDKVVMAAGTFVQGASIELSADAPLRPPYQVYMQGGLTYESGKYGVMTAASKIICD